MKDGQRLHRETGVILRRKISPEGNIWVLCLLRGIGPSWLFVPGGGKGKVRLGGSTEPMVWGEFSLYCGVNKEYLKEMEVKRDFWALRSKKETLFKALSWCRLLGEFLSFGSPADEVLPVLFWSMDMLERGFDPFGTDLRFTYRTLKALGIAPPLDRCCECGGKISKGVWESEGFSCEKCSGKGKEPLDLTLPALWAFGSQEGLFKKNMSESARKEIAEIKELLINNLKLLK